MKYVVSEFFAGFIINSYIYMLIDLLFALIKYDNYRFRYIFLCIRIVVTRINMYSL